MLSTLAARPRSNTSPGGAQEIRPARHLGNGLGPRPEGDGVFLWPGNEGVGSLQPIRRGAEQVYRDRLDGYRGHRSHRVVPRHRIGGTQSCGSNRIRCAPSQNSRLCGRSREITLCWNSSPGMRAESRLESRNGWLRLGRAASAPLAVPSLLSFKPEGRSGRSGPRIKGCGRHGPAPGGLRLVQADRVSNNILTRLPIGSRSYLLFSGQSTMVCLLHGVRLFSHGPDC